MEISKPEVSIVIPIRNEKDNLRPTVKEIEKIIKNWSIDYEILLIDDNSRDGSETVLKDLANRSSCISVLHTCNENNGKDYALQLGMEAAKAPVIITMDGDFQNDPADIFHLIRKLDSCDYVTGFRRIRCDSLKVRICSGIANAFRKIVVKSNVRDAGCQLRAFRTQCVPVLKKYIELFEGNHHYFYPDILQMHGFKIEQIPVNHRGRLYGKSKFGNMKARLVTGIKGCIAMNKLKRQAENNI